MHLFLWLSFFDVEVVIIVVVVLVVGDIFVIAVAVDPFFTQKQIKSCYY